MPQTVRKTTRQPKTPEKTLFDETGDNTESTNPNSITSQCITDTNSPQDLAGIFSKVMSENSYLRHELTTIHDTCETFLLDNAYLAFYLLKHMFIQECSIVINNDPGSGKTSYFATTQALEKQDPGHFVMKYIRPEDREEVIKLCSRLFVFNINCKSLLAEAENKIKDTQEKSIEECFVSKLIETVVDLFIERAQLKQIDANMLTTLKNKSINSLSHNTSHIGTQISIHSTLMKYLVGLITIGNGITKKEPINSTDSNNSNKTKKTKNTTKNTRVEKVIFLIDEANIFRTKHISSSFLGAEYKHRNFMVTLFDRAWFFDTDGTKIRNFQFVFASVLPISTRRETDPNKWKIRSFLPIINDNMDYSFGEICPQKFIQMARAKLKNGEINT